MFIARLVLSTLNKVMTCSKDQELTAGSGHCLTPLPLAEAQLPDPFKPEPLAPEKESRGTQLQEHFRDKPGHWQGFGVKSIVFHGNGPSKELPDTEYEGDRGWILSKLVLNSEKSRQLEQCKWERGRMVKKKK